MKRPALHLGQYALLIALLARIAVPAGFMPADTAQGWFLELCPQGLTAPAMVALLGDNPGRHHHHQSLGKAATAPDAPDYDSHCLLSGFGMAALPAGGLDLPDSFAVGEPIATLPVLARLQSPAAAYRSRAPPRT